MKKHALTFLLLFLSSTFLTAHAKADNNVSHDGYTIYVDDKTGWDNLYLYM